MAADGFDMSLWLVMRYGEPLGRFIAERLEFRDDTLYAIRRGRIIGCVAGGPGLTWKRVPWEEALR